MVQITAEVDDIHADIFIELLKSLTFVNRINIAHPLIQEKLVDEADFFSLEGLWDGREINLTTIRNSAWPIHRI